MAGGFTGQEQDTFDLAGAEGAEGLFEGEGGFAETGGGLQRDGIGGLEGLLEVGTCGLLARAPLGERGRDRESAQLTEMAAALFEDLNNRVEVGV